MNSVNQAVKQVAVLLSGNGSHLQNFIDLYADNSQVNIAVVISNKPDAYGLTRAQEAHIPAICVDHKNYADRDAFEAALIEVMQSYQLDAVILAGFMRILTPRFVEAFKGCLFNIHPSLLPKYPGLHTHQRAIEANDTHAGASVHFVTEELDGGPIILQVEEPISDSDTEQTLASRVLKKEHKIYPLAIQWFLDGKLQLRGNHAYFDSEQLPPCGKNFDAL